MDLVPDTTICVVCMRKVLDKAIQCEKKCERWFHAACMGTSDADYSKLITQTRLNGFVIVLIAYLLLNIPSNLLFNRFDDSSVKMLSLMNDLSKVPSNIAAIKNQLETVNNTFSALEPHRKC